MKEPRGESLANHADLESCAGDGDIAGEALTEALAGRLASRLASREIPCSGADLVDRKPDFLMLFRVPPDFDFSHSAESVRRRCASIDTSTTTSTRMEGR